VAPLHETAVGAARVATDATDATASELLRALALGDPQIVFQPILDLATARLHGHEALARFPHLPGVPVDEVFRRAHAEGVGHTLELTAVRLAVEQAAGRPAGQLLSVNLSPSTLCRPELADRLPRDLDGVQVEITEHEVIADPRPFLAALDVLRRRGARIAVDDVGEGYAGLQQVMAVRPDSLKVDRALVAGVHREPALGALLEAIVRFAARTGAEVCAEGIEEPEELAALADLDVAQGQGWFIGRPSPDLTDASPASRAVCERALARAVAVGDEHESTDLVPVLVRVASATSLSRLAAVLADIAPAIGADDVELSYLDRTGSFVEAVVDSEKVFKGVRYYLDDLPLTRHVLAEDVAAQVVVGDDSADAGEVAWMVADGVGSLLMVPVRSRDRVIGLFECHQRLPVPWRRRQIRAARTVAAVAGPVLENLLRRSGEADR
jgi:EAL domain-containing protein (putative c-di-GMP-specific phosphodiesterase class I)